MKNYHNVKNIRLEKGTISLMIDGKRIQRDLTEVSPLLAAAEEETVLNEFEVSPSGYGIYWPLIDEDISIDGLLDITHQPEQNIKIA